MLSARNIFALVLLLQRKEEGKEVQEPNDYKSDSSVLGDGGRGEENAKSYTENTLFDTERGTWQTRPEHRSTLRTNPTVPAQLPSYLKHSEDSGVTGPLRGSNGNRICDEFDSISWISKPENSTIRNPHDSVASVPSAAVATNVQEWTGPLSQLLVTERNPQGVSWSMRESLLSQSSASTVYEQTRLEVDSLASTSLSMAMTGKCDCCVG